MFDVLSVCFLAQDRGLLRKQARLNIHIIFVSMTFTYLSEVDNCHAHYHPEYVFMILDEK